MRMVVSYEDATKQTFDRTTGNSWPTTPDEITEARSTPESTTPESTMPEYKIPERPVDNGTAYADSLQSRDELVRSLFWSGYDATINKDETEPPFTIEWSLRKAKSAQAG